MSADYNLNAQPEGHFLPCSLKLACKQSRTGLCIHSPNDDGIPILWQVNTLSSFSPTQNVFKFTDDLLWCDVLPPVWGLKYSDANWNCLFFNILTWQSKMLITQWLFAILLLHEVQNGYNHWSCSFPSSPDYVYLSLYFQHLSLWLPIYLYWINDYCVSIILRQTTYCLKRRKLDQTREPRYARHV